MIPMSAHDNPKVQEFLNLLQDPGVYSVFQEMVYKALTDQDGTQLFRRVCNIERHLGADEDHCIGDDLFQVGKDMIMTVPEQLALISERINDNAIPVLKETVFSGNETAVRARLLKDRLPEVNYRNGVKFLSSKEVQTFLLHEVSEEHRTTEKSARKVSNDVMKKAVEMFPETVKLAKNKKRLNIIELIEKR